MKIALQKDYTLKIALDASERVDLLEMYRKCNSTLEKMCEWLEKQPPDEQKKYTDHKHNLRRTMGYLAALCDLAGISDEEITEYIKIPF